MNLLRLLLVALAVWIVIILLRNRRHQAAMKKPPDKQKIDNIVPCASCGMHIPESQALQKDGKYYCSAEHRDQSQN